MTRLSGSRLLTSMGKAASYTRATSAQWAEPFLHNVREHSLRNKTSLLQVTMRDGRPFNAEATSTHPPQTWLRAKMLARHRLIRIPVVSNKKTTTSRLLSNFRKKKMIATDVRKKSVVAEKTLSAKLPYPHNHNSDHPINAHPVRARPRLSFHLVGTTSRRTALGTNPRHHLPTKKPLQHQRTTLQLVIPQIQAHHYLPKEAPTKRITRVRSLTRFLPDRAMAGGTRDLVCHIRTLDILGTLPDPGEDIVGLLVRDRKTGISALLCRRLEGDVFTDKRVYGLNIANLSGV